MKKKIGAEYSRESCRFLVWAPHAEKVDLILKDAPSVSLIRDSSGYWEIDLKISPNSYYKFRVDNEQFPDPASHSQPEGVHSWSQVMPTDFNWTDDLWKGLSASEMIIYELHVGTFSEEGTFEGIIEKLDHLLDLGINTLEIMPISQFPGNRNWGYDGVYPFAVHNSYGSRKSLKKLINTCHEKGLAVLLDVVYNHMGPEGNYFSAFGPYFTEKYQTPWGRAINFDDEYSDEVRNFFLQNAIMWLEEFHFDGLRLDAVHEIIDRGAHHFLKELRETVSELEKNVDRNYVLIAESDLNDARIVTSFQKGGYGIEAQWVDDFHHAIHTYLTGENKGYYSDYGKFEYLAKTIQQAFVYDGTYSTFRKKSVGNSPKSCDPWNFVVSLQNHDQVGNRLLGERLPKLVTFEALKLAAGLLLISPYIPMLFMGEEFAERNPFQYFVSHSDPELIKAVREGRKKEFRYFFKEHQDNFPDPQAEDTFQRSKLNWDFKSHPLQYTIFKYYKELIHFRKSGRFNAFRNNSLLAETHANNLITIFGKDEAIQLIAICNFSRNIEVYALPENRYWNLLFASSDKIWGGSENSATSAGIGNINIHPESIMIFENITIELTD